MLDRLGGASAPTQIQTAAQQPQKILRMVKNERMAGSVPQWETVNSSQHAIEHNLGLAQRGLSTHTAGNSLAYNNTSPTPVNADESFGFADLVDMVNPLQHIPVIGHIYRAISGDEIKPISNIIGGTLFGGPLGLAGGLVNTIVQHETGRDITENAFAFTTTDPDTTTKPDISPQRTAHAEQNSASRASYTDLPAALLSFSDLGHSSTSSAPTTPITHAPITTQSATLPPIHIAAIPFDPYKIY
jgi:hypothetical protein